MNNLNTHPKKSLGSLLDRVFGVVAPNLCLACGIEGFVLCPACMQTAGDQVFPRCAGCKKLSAGYKTCKSCVGWLSASNIFAANLYEGIYEKLIHSYKFESKRQAAKPVAEMMTSVLDDTFNQAKNKFDYICFIPTNSNHIRQRGFDHASLLGSYISNWTNIPLLQFLTRQSNTSQVGSSRTERIEHMSNAFGVINSDALQDKRILIIDDVMTTGATIAASSKLLRQSGAKTVSALIFAQKA